MMATEVLVGQVWTRKDPNGEERRFTVIRLGRDQWNNRFAIGSVGAGRKTMRCHVAEMLGSTGRYTFVEEAPPGAGTCIQCGELPKPGTRLRVGHCVRCYQDGRKKARRAA